ncbi:hypothetical protein H6F98_11490 [Microcoleus sp. FACHB-SPT15]|uniref:hypothetical protein n=1 Tax=Microcoleus sp. FACHB-SPT15 TaxID=2692830 RepID=UPI00177B1DF1|nr:hypothetical protein [Microcoleus sp. FACHB-SPT15]MBD1806070.1 hypothetical protein [Microcoleus sp. FACHB-SPT15]
MAEEVGGLSHSDARRLGTVFGRESVLVQGIVSSHNTVWEKAIALALLQLNRFSAQV